MNLILATSNPGKISEIQEILSEFKLNIRAEQCDVEETGNTLQENALIKARAMAALYPDAWILADDSGLEVDYLKGAPGVHSARYAGEPQDSAANINKLLAELGVDNQRSARFLTVLALICPQGEVLFQGTVSGSISRQIKGSGGFGYDPVFIPDGYEQTFAEMPAAEKNKISHRRMALNQLRNYLSIGEF
jgi:XTP/dITP diphosphohydrolase